MGVDLVECNVAARCLNTERPLTHSSDSTREGLGMNPTQNTVERWLPVPGHEGSYEVSDHGNIRSLDRIVHLIDGRSRRHKGRILADHSIKKGYRQLSLGRRPQSMVHRLVASAFIGPCPPGMEVRHLDGNPSNNHIGNLRYGTPSENTQDTLRHGRHNHARKTHCVHGHEYTPENTYRTPSHPLHRYCRECRLNRRPAQRLAQQITEGTQ